MVSSFRALSFASRVSSGKKMDEDEREKGRERKGRETVSFSFSLSAEATKNSKPEGRIFFNDSKKKRERDGVRGMGGERRIEGGRRRKRKKGGR